MNTFEHARRFELNISSIAHAHIYVQVHDFEVLLSRLGAHHRLCAWLPKFLSDEENGLGLTGVAEQSLSDSCERTVHPSYHVLA